jgi:hypothetical protein
MGEEEKTKMLGLMKFWLFGTFIIIFAAVTVYTGAAVGTGLDILGEANYWYAMVLTAALCVAWYFVYRWYLNRK